MRKADRLQERTTKIKERLGIKDAGDLGRQVYDFDRPKGMHHKTFNRFQVEANCYLRDSLQLRAKRFPVDVDMIFGGFPEDLG